MAATGRLVDSITEQRIGDPAAATIVAYLRNSPCRGGYFRKGGLLDSIAAVLRELPGVYGGPVPWQASVIPYLFSIVKAFSDFDWDGEDEYYSQAYHQNGVTCLGSSDH